MQPVETVSPQWVRATRAPVPLPPPKSCDCQFHIYGDPAQYPPKRDAFYQPPQATFEDMRGVLKALGFERGVIVHPMPYDTDHRLLIDTLSGLSPDERKNFRATGIIKNNVADATIRQLDGLGVRGARFNFGKRYEGIQSRDAILRSIDRAREIGWHARLHVPPTTSRRIRNSWNRSRTSPAWSTIWPTCISTAGSTNRPAGGSYTC
jgi:2-pyrone-4,6-dicarboxylate lactonase